MPPVRMGNRLVSRRRGMQQSAAAVCVLCVCRVCVPSQLCGDVVKLAAQLSLSR